MPVTIAFVRETAAGERRAAITPETCKKLVANQARVALERGAGTSAGFPDDTYAGADFADRAALLREADVIVCVQPPANAELALLKPGAIVIGLLAPHADAARVDALVAAKATAL